MPPELIFCLIASLLAVGAMRWLPRRFGPDAVAAISTITLAAVSWQSALFLVTGIVVTFIAMVLGERLKAKAVVFVPAVIAHLATLLLFRELPVAAWLGAAYFTLRHIHVLSDWWCEELPCPRLGDYARYHLFLPVLAAGPIHRFAPFQRQLARRRNDTGELVSGAERTLWGTFQFTVLANAIIPRVERACIEYLAPIPTFFSNWVQSAFDWIALYLSFAGLSSIAIGLSLMMGLRIEENFNAPWRATSLPDFWSRWHMSLTNFSRDYVFRPVAALSRSPITGAFAAMLFLGLWHGSSVYWLGWGAWQGLGIVLTILARRTQWFSELPKSGGPVFVALWLTATYPVVNFLTGASPQ